MYFLAMWMRVSMDSLYSGVVWAWEIMSFIRLMRASLASSAAGSFSSRYYQR